MQKFFTTYDSSAVIDYTPEKSLHENLNMVKTLKGHVKQLELGSKMRKDVWLKEIERCEYLSLFEEQSLKYFH